jgi:hypothetical protein
MVLGSGVSNLVATDQYTYVLGLGSAMNDKNPGRPDSFGNGLIYGLLILHKRLIKI